MQISLGINVRTHQQLKDLARQLDTTMGQAVSLAVRAMRQDLMGRELSSPLREDENAWLDAGAG